jgi:hypothetical protein
MKCAAQNLAVNSSLDRRMNVPALIEGCRPQSRRFHGRARVFQRCSAALADKAAWPEPLEQKVAHFVGTFLLEFRK